MKAGDCECFTPKRNSRYCKVDLATTPERQSEKARVCWFASLAANRWNGINKDVNVISDVVNIE